SSTRSRASTVWSTITRRSRPARSNGSEGENAAIPGFGGDFPVGPFHDLALEAPIGFPLSPDKNFLKGVEFRRSRSSLRCRSDEAASVRRQDDACDGVREGDRRWRKWL